MLLLLPPSETKRDGGTAGSALNLAALGFQQLGEQRKGALAALRRLSRSVGESSSALGLSTTQRFEIDRNRAILTSPVMPALDRYTGVLYDALDAGTLSAIERDFANEHVAIHSALFALVRAGDEIPAYRLSHNSRLPNLSLRALWREPISAVLAAQPGLILDLRSESYVQLGPAPHAVRVRVVSEDAAGRRVALTHFNKRGKGLLVRSLIEAGVDHASRDSLLAWARTSGLPLEPGPDDSVDFVF